ncbi:MAG: PIN domain nuclease [Deltaproteobacteria bacterium]|nr:PIN domain nuclease [Deltaproteobacteria bacterium]
MIIVDSSVWISYFNCAPTPQARHLWRLFDLEREPVVVLPIIVFESLSGFRDDRSFLRGRDALLDVPVLDTDATTHAEAAALYRSLRKRGVTVRSPVDCLIAQACIDAGARLLTEDRDFDAIAAHSALRLVDPLAPE